MPASKLTGLPDAVLSRVPDASAVAMGTAQETLIPFAAGHEIIRQRKRGLTLIGPISDILFDQIIGAGCVDKVQGCLGRKRHHRLGLQFQACGRVRAHHRGGPLDPDPGLGVDSRGKWAYRSCRPAPRSAAIFIKPIRT